MVHLKRWKLETPLGAMSAMADEKRLHFLGFGEEREWKGLPLGRTGPIEQIEAELELYFKGKLRKFATPLILQGSPFHIQVWEALQKIPFGEVRSYADVAAAIGRPRAYRAVGRGNGLNRFVIAIPCHRVISADGKLGGYSAGLERKQWLLQHEEKTCGF